MKIHVRYYFRSFVVFRAYDGPDYNGREIAQCYLYYGG